MGIDLALQGFHARLQKQPFLLFEFHFDAHVVQDFERDGNCHDGAGIDCEFDQPTVAIKRENTARKGAMHLDAHELESEDQQQEGSLPVDQRLANAAANPVVDAQVEERRERPHGFALGGNVPQQTRQEAGQNVHGEGEPFAKQQRWQRDQDAAGGSDEASADYAHQDGAFKRDIGGVEVADPATHQHAERDRDADDEDNFDLLAEVAFFAEEQNAEATGAHQHTADRRGDAEAD